ncbi:MBL fold metallo-hydrolase [Candidatus Woesearchaeota archaeon]|nr:MBL fold metallo-hydrolase [Candidatus Woesearchaeota archaeon]
MRIAVLASGSNGNCCLVENNGLNLLIDAGLSGKETERRLNQVGTSLENIDAILITHSHSDHVRGAGIISRRHNIPVYLTRKTHKEAPYHLAKARVKYFSQKNSFLINSHQIQPILTSHSVCSSGFVIEKFGLFTDTGIITKQMQAAIPKLKAVVMESNHDIDMLINGPYPYYLKQWILSEKGHLSNVDASSFLQQHGENMSLALLGHMSENNNTPELAVKTFETLVKRKTDFMVCSREGITGSWEI